MTKTVHCLKFVLLATTCLTTLPALAGELPTGGRTVHGAVDVSAASPNRMTIRQSSSRAVVNWRSFSIGQDAHVDIRQPGRSAALLNRVDGSARSTIAGQLTANGRVYLVNPNGVLITATGVVRTGSFVASTLDMDDADFLAGRDRFAGRGASAAVENQGRIAVESGGYAALLGGAVDNSGIVSVPLGKVGLGAGERATLDLSGDGFLQVALPSDGDGNDALIRNSGRIAAAGGRVEMLAATARRAARNAINLSGVVEARSVSGRNGAIVLGGGPGGAVRVSGRLDASAPAEPAAAPRRGGEILVTGETVLLTAATLDASGPEGGGRIRIGGDWGGGGALERAAATHVDAGTLIRADAETSGDGGSVVVWSDQRTDFLGRISARGGPEGGDGGAAEVSAPLLAFGGSVDLSAPRGAIGDLLLDPYNVFIEDIDSGEVQEILDADDNVIGFVWPSTVVQNVLADVDLTIETTGDGEGPSVGDITIGAPLAWNQFSTLTLLADNDIIIAQPIAAPLGGLTLNAAGTITTPATWIDSGGVVQTGGNGAIAVGVFTLDGGDWNQNAAVLPDFAATDFRIAGGSYLRALGGAGTPGQPYQITDVYGLQGIGSGLLAPLDASYALANDIDAGGTENWNNIETPEGFAPIGTADRAATGLEFTGTLDGGGATIDGLFIDRPTELAVGLFAGTEGATVTDLRLTNVNVTGGLSTGALIGISDVDAVDPGEVSVVSVIDGSVAGLGASEVGGLIGWSRGTEVSDVFTTVAVTWDDAPVCGLCDVGGLIGWNFGTILRSFASGPVTVVNAVPLGQTLRVGGLVGANSGGSIAQSYATGAVSATTAGPRQVGGLTGSNAAAISQAYAAGAVVSAGAGTAAVGGLVGLGGGTALASYWDQDATGQAGSAGGTGLTTAELQDTEGFMALAEPQGWDFETDWAPPGPGDDGGGFYPELYALSPVVRIDADDAARDYGDGNPALTFTQFGGPGSYLFGPDGDALTVPVTLATDATPESDVGDYDIVVDAPGFVDSAGDIPYRVVATDGVLTVTPADLTVTANDQRKTYGEIFVFDGTEFTVTGLRNADTVTSATITSEGAPGTAGARVHVIGIDAAQGTGLGNYVIAYEEGDFTVERADLTVTANDQRKTYGETFTFLGTEFTVDGLLNADTVTSATIRSEGAPVTANATAGTDPHVIEISDAQGTGLGNYNIAYEEGDFTVERADLTVTADDQRKTYGETFAFLGTEFTVDGLLNADRVTSATLTSEGAPGTANATAGTNPYVIGISNLRGEGLGNYNIRREPGDFTVDRAPLTVAANDQRKNLGRTFVFDGTEFSVDGLRNDDRVNRARFASDGAPAGARVGTYAIDVSGAQGTGLGNYDIAYVPGEFTVDLPPSAAAAPPSQLMAPDTELPNPVDTITFAAFAVEGLEAEEAPESGGGGPRLGTGEAAVDAAERTLAQVTRISDDLAARTRSCELGRSEADAFLACIGDGLAAYARGLGAPDLDLPAPLRAISAHIETAARSIAGVRARAAQRIAAAGSPEEIRSIEREAIAEARAAMRAVVGEVSKQIELIRADDADVARLQAQQGRTIAAALETVDDILVRATEL